MHTSARGPSGARPAPPLPKDPLKANARENNHTQTYTKIYTDIHIHIHTDTHEQIHTGSTRQNPKAATRRKKINALPVPLLRQVYIDTNEQTSAHTEDARQN